MVGSGLVDRWQAAINHEPRADGWKPQLIVLHYTGMSSGPAAVDWLCSHVSKVSCHYLVDVDGTIVQMVDEERRAWHAGQSEWYGEVDVNSMSIGIEVQNLGHAAGCPPFPREQMQKVALLCLDVMRRHVLSPQQVVAHSDVAPGRKIDPGEAFDWQYLASHGVGTMVVSGRVEDVVLCQTGDVGEQVAHVQQNFAELGYGIAISGTFDNRTRIVVEAFQRRFRPSKVDGRLDQQCDDILKRLMAVQPGRVVWRTA